MEILSLKSERFGRNCTSRGKCTHDIRDNPLPFHRHFVPLHQLWKPRPIRWNEHPNRWNNHPVPHHPHRHWQPHSLGKEEVKRLMVRRWFGDGSEKVRRWFGEGSEKEGRWDGDARVGEYRNTFCTITITMTITMNRTDEKGSLSDSLCINCWLVSLPNHG